MGILALPWYGVLLSWAYALSVSEQRARTAMETLVESRRQLLVSPLTYRRSVCVDELQNAPAPQQETSMLSPFVVRCDHDTLWRKQQEWQPLCRNFGSDAELYAPRYYRLLLKCTYQIGKLSLPLPSVSWDVYR